MAKRSLLVVGFAFWMVSVASAADVSVSEKTFGCILDWPQVRNTRIKHADPQQLTEAVDRLPTGASTKPPWTRTTFLDVDLAAAAIVSSFLHRMSNDYGFPAHRRVRTGQYQGYARCPSGDRHRA
jgi:hypothetical protein